MTSTNQPLWVKNGTWIGMVNDPRNLTVGEYLYNPTTSTWIEITSLSTLTTLTPVYDLQVGGPGDFKAGGVLSFLKYDGGGI